MNGSMSGGSVVQSIRQTFDLNFCTCIMPDYRDAEPLLPPDLAGWRTGSGIGRETYVAQQVRRQVCKPGEVFEHPIQRLVGLLHRTNFFRPGPAKDPGGAAAERSCDFHLSLRD